MTLADTIITCGSGSNRAKRSAACTAPQQSTNQNIAIALQIAVGAQLGTPTMVSAVDTASASASASAASASAVPAPGTPLASSSASAVSAPVGDGDDVDDLISDEQINAMFDMVDEDGMDLEPDEVPSAKTRKRRPPADFGHVVGEGSTSGRIDVLGITHLANVRTFYR